MTDTEEVRRQQTLLRRLEALGLRPEPMPGGRCALVTLPFGPEPLPTLGKPRRLEAVRFATVGTDRIKCLAPRALFHLPLIPISDCDTREALEARIRETWRARLAALQRARAWLERLGVEPDAPADTPQWTFPMEAGAEAAQGRCIDAGAVILPSAGPLAGMPLDDAKQRVMTLDGSVGSGTDFEIALSNRMEALARADAKARARQRRHGIVLEPPPRPAANGRRAPLLLIGPGLESHRALQDSLHLRGFDVVASRSIQEALDAFQERSFELVLTEARLDRADGVEVIPALQALPGVSRVPILVLDDRPRQSRRDEARRAGAAGYLTQPFEVAKLAPMFDQLVNKPRHRRFTRYARPVSVAWRGAQDPEVTSAIGRLGMFVRTEHPLPLRACERFELYLPEFGSTVSVESEVVYKLDGAGRSTTGVGLRFRGFEAGGEALWVSYLRALERAPARC